MNRTHLSLRYTTLVLFILASTWAWADRQPVQPLKRDSLNVKALSWSELPQGQMLQSAHPVKLSVKGRSLRITSRHEQVLPIYTNGGTLYLAMQLSPGVNWLNGLPRGHYRINNRTIKIK